MKTSPILALLIAWFLFTSSVSLGKDIERTDFEFSVPDGTKVGDETPVSSGDEKYQATEVELPNGYVVVIVALPDKAFSDKEVEWARKYTVEQYKNAKEAPTKLFDKHGGKGTIVKGLLSDMDFCSVIGSFDGKEKGFIFVCHHPTEDTEKTGKFLRTIIDSFKIKE